MTERNGTTPHGSLGAGRYPQEQKLDRDTVRRWRSEAITAPAQDRLWLNRCEALCNALIDKQAELAVAYGDGRSSEETEWFSALDRAKEELERLRATLQAIHGNARSYHALAEGKERALNVIGNWAEEALAGRIHESVEKITRA